jgi:hypothetical protein
METLNMYRDKLERALEKYPCINGPLAEIEKKTNVKKIYLAYGNRFVIYECRIVTSTNYSCCSYCCNTRSPVSR